jgi:prolyl oligopeptidase
MAEFGNPDIPAQWAYIRKYSPLQNLRKDRSYPKVFFLTSTKDDRVHPAHAREMAAKMQAFGKEFYYYESVDGGHMGFNDFDESATETAVEYLYLIKQLGVDQRH